MTSLLQEYRSNFPLMPLYLRGDSGFAAPGLYEVCEEYDCTYAIRLKNNSMLEKLAYEADLALYRATKHDAISYAVEYGEFMYQASGWSHPRRVVFKIEKPYESCIHMYTFIVTTMKWNLTKLSSSVVAPMENFIKESKSGFDFSAVSSHQRVVNANRLQVHALAYNLFNWFRRLALAVSMRKKRRYHPFGTAEDCHKGSPFSKIYHIQAM